MDFSSFWNVLLLLFLLALILFIIFLLYLYFNQNNILFETVIEGEKYPEDNPDPYKSPLQFGLKYKEIKTITKDNLTLYGWLIYLEENKKDRTLLFFHENFGSKYNIS